MMYFDHPGVLHDVSNFKTLKRMQNLTFGCRGPIPISVVKILTI